MNAVAMPYGEPPVRNVALTVFGALLTTSTMRKSSPLVSETALMYRSPATGSGVTSVPLVSWLQATAAAVNAPNAHT